LTCKTIVGFLLFDWSSTSAEDPVAWSVI
jgi:hypothetical protein